MAKRAQRSERRGHQKTVDTGGIKPDTVQGSQRLRELMPKQMNEQDLGRPRIAEEIRTMRKPIAKVVRQPITTLVNRGGRMMPELATSHEPGVYTRFYGTTKVTTAKPPKK